MMLLDTVMDALSAVFPNLTRGTDPGISRPGGGGGDSSGEAQNQGTFAATLIQFLGGAGNPMSQIAEEARTHGSQTWGESREGDGPADLPGVLAGSMDEIVVAGGDAAGGDAEGQDAAVEAGTGAPEPEESPHQPGRSQQHASEMGLRRRGENGVPYSGRTPSPVDRASQATKPVSVEENGRETSLAAKVGKRPIPPATEPGISEKRVIHPDEVRDGTPSSGRASEAGGEEMVRPPSLGLSGSTATPPPPGLEPEPASVPEAASGTSSGEAVEVAKVHTVQREMDLLEPEFRERLDRVIHRMQTEYGHQVKVTETYRSPERQDALFAQGRSQPGPVVTWTRSSLHAQGRAADLQIDGSWENPAGYARLQQVAREEGLQTLGPRDPGHLEFPAEDSLGTSRRWASGTESAAEKQGYRRVDTGGVAPPAPVAPPVSVARPARVASVARPPRPGSITQGVSPVSEDSPAPAQSETLRAPREGGEALKNQPPQWTSANPTPQGSSARRAAGESSPPVPLVAEAGPGSKRGESSESAVDGAAGNKAFRGTPESARNESALAPQTMSAGSSVPPNGPQAPSPTGAPGVVNRVDEIQALEEVLSARGPGRVHLEMENADGAGTRIRLSLRGGELAGSVDISDPVATERMRARIGELHDALARRGLDARSLAVQGIRGMESGGGAQTDLASLLQDPLTGLARILDGRESGPEGRNHRGGQARADEDGQFGKSGNTDRQDREKEAQK